MAVVPEQKPGRSRQDYQTPPLLLSAVSTRLSAHFVRDLAASPENAVTDRYYTIEDNALTRRWAWDVQAAAPGWAWCNPPFADIEPWVKKAGEEAARGLSLALLVPASVGSRWWQRYVEPYAYAWHCCPRVTFVGETTPYPKDLSVLIYTPLKLRGAETWDWTG